MIKVTVIRQESPYIKIIDGSVGIGIVGLKRPKKMPLAACFKLLRYDIGEWLVERAEIEDAEDNG